MQSTLGKSKALHDDLTAVRLFDRFDLPAQEPITSYTKLKIATNNSSVSAQTRFRSAAYQALTLPADELGRTRIGEHQCYLGGKY